MFEIRQGDIFSYVENPINTTGIVNTVNCVGTMGAGLALEFKKRYPAMVKEYSKLCKKGGMTIGQVWPWHEHEGHCNDHPCVYVINFPAKDHWKNPSRLEWIASGIDSLKVVVENLHIETLVLPALGCGLGGLKFDDVAALVDDKLGGLETFTILLTPQ